MENKSSTELITLGTLRQPSEVEKMGWLAPSSSTTSFTWWTSAWGAFVLLMSGLAR